MIPAEELELRRHQCCIYFDRRYGHIFPNLKKDFGQYCCEQWLRGRHFKTQFRFLAIDFLRIHGVNVGKQGSEDMMNSKDTELTEHMTKLKVVDHSMKQDVKLDASLLPIQGLDRVMFILHHQWGLSYLEIAHCVGRSNAWVCTELERITKLVKSRCKTNSYPK